MDKRFICIQGDEPPLGGPFVGRNGGTYYARYPKWWYRPIYSVGRWCEHKLFQKLPRQHGLIYLFRHFINLD